MDSDAGSSTDRSVGFSIVAYDNEPKTFNKLVRRLNKLSSKTQQRDLIVDYIEGNYKTSISKKIIIIAIIVFFLCIAIFAHVVIKRRKNRMGEY